MTPLALAIVFPQFHAIPENDELWGVNFTEWTFLKPMPRHVIDEVIYKPHPDLGYYNILDYGHRRFMRVLADRFGIHGFCFYHFWFKDHPVMHRPLELMLKDGEPKKPFVLCWANENWTRAWDGLPNDVILAQDYSDHEGNVKHFYFLLPFFRNKRNIRINKRPVFIWYRIDREHAEIVAGIMTLWQELARKEGLPGIHFMRFGQPPTNDWAPTDDQGLQGFVQFEPGYSSPWGKVGRQPADAGQWAGFWLFNAPEIWATSEHRRQGQAKEFYRGTVLGWNNAPRRGWTNGNYEGYPRIYRNATADGFGRHVQRVYDLAVQDTSIIAGPENYVFFAAWNEWNEQSILEPNDVTGYDMITTVKRAFKPHTGKTVVHLSHPGGGTEAYMKHLMGLFADYNHTWIQDGNPPSPSRDCALLHIHSAMVLEGPGWRVIDIARAYRARKVPVYVTVHDYQWLFPTQPNPSLEVLQTTEPGIGNMRNASKLFQMANRVIFPERSIYEYYRTQISSKHWDEEKVVMVPHNDLIIHDDRFYVAPVADNTINVAYVGRFVEFKGAELFLALSKSGVLPAKHNLQFRFHQFGELEPRLREGCTTVEFYDLYDDNEIELILQQQNIHIVTFLSIFPETYSYVTTRILRAGIPVVYLARGALTERLAQVKHAFAVDEPTLASVEAGISRAVEFVMEHQGADTILREQSPNIQPTKWYLNNYPEIAEL